MSPAVDDSPARVAWQSTTSLADGPDLAIDGAYDGPCSSTEAEAYSTWSVQLSYIQPIARVEITPNPCKFNHSLYKYKHRNIHLYS